MRPTYKDSTPPTISTEQHSAQALTCQADGLGIRRGSSYDSVLAQKWVHRRIVQIMSGRFSQNLVSANILLVLAGSSAWPLPSKVVSPLPTKGASTLSAPAAAKMSEVQITLFGQPCTLSGPFNESVLQAIHAISPEQAYPSYLYEDASRVTPPQLRQMLERIRKSPNPVPSLLDRYREKLGKRLDEMLPFFDGLDALRKTGKSTQLVEGTRKLMTEKAAETFGALAKKLSQKKAASNIKPDSELDLKNRLFEIYDSVIEPDPQEEFHRAIRKMNVNYVCSYEESETEQAE